ncbi:hypothetical protein [Synechococcus sp. M16CYN]|uniref:hypothetical protein n=1 Tax=Synechococcus sp. M16CYN TaxID=3103139 RepID=UPI00333FFBAF
MAGKSLADLNGDSSNGLSTRWSILNGNKLSVTMGKIAPNLNQQCPFQTQRRLLRNHLRRSRSFGYQQLAPHIR